MISLREILKAEETRNFVLLNELSLLRAYQHFKASGVSRWAMLSVVKVDCLEPGPSSADDVLERRLQSMGLGFHRLHGIWRRDRDREALSTTLPCSRNPDSRYEPLYFIYGISLAQCRQAAKKLRFGRFLFQGPESGDMVILVHPGGATITIGSFDPSAIAAAWGNAVLPGSSFRGFSMGPQCWIEAVIAHHFKASIRLFGLNHVLSDSDLKPLFCPRGPNEQKNHNQ